MLSLAFKPAHLELVPSFERATGHKVVSLWVSTVNMMRRLQEGEAADLVIAPSMRVDEMGAAGLIADRTELARSGVGVAVKAGAARPDISSEEALKRAVLAAKSIVYSTGPSGVHLAGVFERMGISGEIKGRIKQVQGEPTAGVVARGEAEIAFQQMSELLPVPGIDIVGPLPPETQEITTFLAVVPVRAEEPQAAKALIAHFKTPAAIEVIRKWGLEPG
jgi:molybdate transport system substrate-binding protein